MARRCGANGRRASQARRLNPAPRQVATRPIQRRVTLPPCHVLIPPLALAPPCDNPPGIGYSYCPMSQHRPTLSRRARARACTRVALTTLTLSLLALIALPGCTYKPAFIEPAARKPI